MGTGFVGDISSARQNTSSSGSAGVGTQVGGITSPIVIGGFKSDGSATATNTPTLAIVGGVLLLLGIWWAVHRRSKS